MRTAAAAISAALLVALLPARPAAAQDGVEITVTEVGEDVYMLKGRGGNMALCVGADGPILVDDQFAPLTEKIQRAIATVAKDPVRFVINTHWHGDHTGGNESFGEAGALIVAHENVRKRMSTEQFMKTFNRKVPPSPKGALPVVTFNDEVTLHWNGEAISVTHAAAHAHTDGDGIVRFTKANVIHTGDTFVNGTYPFIDTSSGGSIVGIISSADRVLALCDEETKIIPGHGELATKKELKAFRDMLVTVRDRLVKLIEAGKSLDEIRAAAPTADLDEQWGKGFMKPDVFVGLAVESLKAHRAARDGAKRGAH